MSWLLKLSAVTACFAAPLAAAEKPARENAKEEAAILKNAEAFVEAFHNGDAKALAAFWTPDGDYTMTWESKDRTEEGKPLPDVKPIKLKRAK